MFTLVIPFMIQERLLFVLTVFILVSTIFNGKIYSTKKVKYKMIFDKDDQKSQNKQLEKQRMVYSDERECGTVTTQNNK